MCIFAQITSFTVVNLRNCVQTQKMIVFDGIFERHEMRTTVDSIAKEAGVSTATVDRVLNDRGGVRAKTRALVMQTAEQLGYFGVPQGARDFGTRMDFVLPGGTNSFMSQLRSHLVEEALAVGAIKPRMHVTDGFQPELLAQRLLDLRGETDAVGVVALDHPAVREAIDQLAADGVRVATLVSDLPSVRKAGYIGVDNRAAGRLAGMLIGRFLPPEKSHTLAVFIGSTSYRGHEEREMGIRSILTEDFPNIAISRLIEVNDDRDVAYQRTKAMLEKEKPNALYNIGSGNQGIARALREYGLARDVVFIAHDLTDATKILLIDRTIDAVIEQNPRVEAREIVKLLLSAVRGSKEPEYLPRLQVIFRENIPLS